MFCIQYLLSSEIVSFMRQCGKLLTSRTGHRRQNGACALHAGYYGYKHAFRVVILTPFPLQQWLHKHASVFSYMYTACLVYIIHSVV